MLNSTRICIYLHRYAGRLATRGGMRLTVCGSEGLARRLASQVFDSSFSTATAPCPLRGLLGCIGRLLNKAV